MAGGVRVVAADGRPEGARDRALAPALVKAFEEAKDDDPRVRRYLALAIGARAALRSRRAARRSTSRCAGRLTGCARRRTDSEDARISTIWALGSSGDAVRRRRRSQPLYESADAGIRKMVVYALGALPGDAQLDDAADGAAGRGARRALERGGRARAARQPRGRAGAAADARSRVRRADGQARRRGQDEDMDPVADVMISGLRAAAALKDASAAGRRSRS